MFLAALTHSLTHTLTRTNLQPRWPTKGSSVVGGIEAQYGKGRKVLNQVSLRGQKRRGYDIRVIG